MAAGDEMNITVFLGAPGSGKGTQAKRLAEGGQFRHFSTGDMLRAAQKDGTEVGIKAKKFIDAGELVPDSIMIELIEDALRKLPGNAKVILDGFPRTVPQAEALDVNSTTKVKVAVYFQMPEPELIARLTGRRICTKCGEPFHVEFMPPKRANVCDKCGSSLMQRPDDAEAVVRRRLEVFKSQNDGLLSYYQGKSKLQSIDANQPVGSIQTKLTQLLH